MCAAYFFPHFLSPARPGILELARGSESETIFTIFLETMWTLFYPNKASSWCSLSLKTVGSNLRSTADQIEKNAKRGGQ